MAMIDQEVFSCPNLISLSVACSTRHNNESPVSPLSRKRFRDDLRHVGTKGITSGKALSRAQAVWSGYNQLSTRGGANAVRLVVRANE